MRSSQVAREFSSVLTHVKLVLGYGGPKARTLLTTAAQTTAEGPTVDAEQPETPKVTHKSPVDTSNNFHRVSWCQSRLKERVFIISIYTIPNMVYKVYSELKNLTLNFYINY